MKRKTIIFCTLFHFFAIHLNCFSVPKTFLVFGGKTGWLGKQFISLLTKQGHNAIAACSRLENREEIIREIEQTKPNFIINAAGITGRPNIDWCEDHQQETLRTNLIGTLNLIDIAYMHNIHITNISTGCIYQYDDLHPLASGKGFTEQDDPNFTGSFYSKTKILLEKAIQAYPNVLNLRLRMPIADDLTPRAFIGKIIKYKKFVNIPNSMSVIHDLLPIAIEMTLKGYKGIYNWVNPGTISHNEILELYKKYIDPSFSYENFSIEEQAKILKAGRSNCELDASKLLSIFPTIPSIQESIIKVFEHMRKTLSKKQLSTH
jgi:3,5-epimerase/4-reductase